MIKLDNYVEKFLKDDSEIKNKNTRNKNLEFLNKELRKIVLERFK